MDAAWIVAPVLGVVWGVVWAVFLQTTSTGRWLAHQRTWITVAAGVGVDILIVAPFIDLEAWLLVVAVVGVSSVGMIARSLYNEYRDHDDI